MTKELILATVKKHLLDAVEGLDETMIDPGKSMKDLGANSLDMVEVVSCTMRELKIKVPQDDAKLFIEGKETKPTGDTRGCAPG